MEKINPTQKPYISLSPLKLCLTNFPFIDADFDALTDYEFLCKVVEYLNKVIANEQNVSYNVQELYNAFLELQNEIIDELNAQNQRIDDYFEDTNIQAFVDNKINEMIETNEFQALIIDAINEINPSVLKVTNKIQIISFDTNFYPTQAPLHIIQANLLNNTNKQLLIDAINKCISEDNTMFYFINKNDLNVLYYDCEILKSGDIITELDVNPHFDLNKIPIEVNQEYTDYFSLSITQVNNVVTDLTFLTEVNKNYKELNINNTIAYTPTADYQPATKKYVDDNAGGGGGSTPTPFVQYNGSSADTYILFEPANGGWFFDNNDIPTFGALLTDLNTNGLNNLLMYFGNSVNNNYQLIRIETDFTTYASDNVVLVKAYPIFDSLHEYNKFGTFGSSTDYINYITLGFDTINGVFTNINFTFVDVNHSYHMYLPINNYEQFDPYADYDPATKKYVDDSILTVSVNAIQTNNSGFLYPVDNQARCYRSGKTYQIIGSLVPPVVSTSSATPFRIPAEFGPYEPTTNGRVALVGTCTLVGSSDSLQVPYQLVERYYSGEDAYYFDLMLYPIPRTLDPSDDYIYFNIMWIRYEEPTI